MFKSYDIIDQSFCRSELVKLPIVMYFKFKVFEVLNFYFIYN